MSEKKQTRTTRKLTKAHEHRGVLYPAGSEIELLPDQERRLDEQKKLVPKGSAAPSS